MDRIVYILGTRHEYQLNTDKCEPSATEEFSLYLGSLCRLHGIEAIGEEMSISVLEEHKIEQSIPAIFAKSFGNLPHKYCDPDHAVQKRMGIKLPIEMIMLAKQENWSKEKFETLDWNNDLKREPYWLCQIQDLNLWPLLFICGMKHVESFRKLLSVATFTVHIVNNTWESQADRMGNKGDRFIYA